MGSGPVTERAKVGYWIRRPYWNRGYATKALGSNLGYGLHVKGLNRINAYFMTENRAQARFLRNVVCGMKAP